MSQLRQYSRARVAITTAFIINGTTAGAFYARVPDFKRELGVTNSALGFALLCIAIGVLLGLDLARERNQLQHQHAVFASRRHAHAPVVHRHLSFNGRFRSGSRLDRGKHRRPVCGPDGLRRRNA